MDDLINKAKQVFKRKEMANLSTDIKLTMTVSGQTIDNTAWESGQFFNYTTGTCINYYPLAFTISSGTPDIKSVTGTVSGLTNGSTVKGVYLSEQPSDWPSYNPFSWNGAGWYLLLTVPDSDSLNGNQLSNSTVFNLSATATDATGATATFSFTEAQVEAAPYYPTYTLPNATVGKAYTYTLTPTNSDYVQVDGQDGNDLIWMSLPKWLEDNSQADPNGNFAYIFNGTPTEAGTYTVKGQNQNVNGLQCGNYVFTVTVDPAPATKPASSDSDKKTTSSSGSDSKPSSSNDTPAKSSTPAPKSDSSSNSSGGSSSGDKTAPSTPSSTPSKSESSSSSGGDSSTPKPVVKTVKPFVTLSLPTTGWAYGANNLLVGGFGNGQSNTLYVPLNVEFTDSTDTTSACPTPNLSFIIKSVTGLSNTSSVSASVLENTDFGSTGDVLPSPADAYGPLVTGNTGCYLVFNFGNIVEYFNDVNTYMGQPSFVNGERQVTVEVEVEYADIGDTSTVTYTATETFTFDLSFLVGGCIMQSTGNTGTNGYTQSYPLLPGVAPGGKLNCSIPLYTTSEASSIIFKKGTGAPSWIDISYSDGNIVFSGTAPSTAMTEAATFEFMITDGTHAFNQTVAYIVIDNPQVTTGNYNGSAYLGDVNFQFNQNWLNSVQNNEGGAYPCISLFSPTQTVYLPLTGFPSEYTGFAVSGATVNNSNQVGPNFPAGTTVTCQYLSTQPADYMVTPQNPWTGPGYYIIISLQNGQEFWTKSSNGASAAGYQGSQASIYIYCMCEGNVNQWYGNTQTICVCFDYAPKFLIPSAYTGSVGFPVNESISSQNDCPSSSWSIASTTGFPTGVKVAQNGNNIQLTGNPTAAGTFNGQVVLNCNTAGQAPSGSVISGESHTTVSIPMQIAADAQVADEDYSFTIGLPSTGWLYGENNVLVIGEFDAMTVSLPLQPVFKNLTRKETVIVAAGDYTCQITKVTGLADNSYVSISTPDSYTPVVAGPLNPLPTEDNASYLVIDLESIPLYFNTTSSTNTPSFVNGVKELTVDLSASYVDSETGKTFTATQTLTLNLIFLQSGFNGYVSVGNITKNTAFTGLPTLPVWNTDVTVDTSVPLTSLSGNLTVTKGSNFPTGIDVSYSKGNLVFSGKTTATSMTDPGKLEVNVVDGSNSYTLTFAYFINTFTGSGLSGPTTTYEVASGLSSTPVVTGGDESVFFNNTWEAVTNGFCIILPGVTKIYIPVTFTQYPPMTVSSSNPSISIEYLTTQPSDYNESKYNPWTGAGYYAVITGTAEELQSLPQSLQIYVGVTYSYPYGGSNISSQIMMNTLDLTFSFMPAPQFDSKGFPSCYVGTPYQETLQAINDVPFTFVSTTSLPPGITFVTKTQGTSFLATGNATKAGTFMVQAVVNVSNEVDAPITIPFTVLPALPKATKVVYGGGDSGTGNGSDSGKSDSSSGSDGSSSGSSGSGTSTSGQGTGSTGKGSSSSSSGQKQTSSSNTPASGSSSTGDKNSSSSTGTTPPAKSDSSPSSSTGSTPDKTTSKPSTSSGTTPTPTKSETSSPTGSTPSKTTTGSGKSDSTGSTPTGTDGDNKPTGTGDSNSESSGNTSSSSGDSSKSTTGSGKESSSGSTSTPTPTKSTGSSSSGQSTGSTGDKDSPAPSSSSGTGKTSSSSSSTGTKPTSSTGSGSSSTPSPTKTTPTPPAPITQSLSLPEGFVNVGYSQYVSIPLTAGVFTFTKAEGNPSWLTVTQVGSQLYFQGMPSEVTTSPITFQVLGTYTSTSTTDPTVTDATFNCSLSITEKLHVSYNTPITTAPGQSLTLQPTVTNAVGNPTFAFIGAVPTSLQISSLTGIISGSLSQTGSTTLTVSCSDNGQTVQTSIVINVAQPLKVTYPAISGVVGKPVSVSPTVTNGLGTKTFSLSTMSQTSATSPNTSISQYVHQASWETLPQSFPMDNKQTLTYGGLETPFYPHGKDHVSASPVSFVTTSGTPTTPISPSTPTSSTSAPTSSSTTSSSSTNLIPIPEVNGLSLNTVTGEIVGTPTLAGSTSFQVQCTDQSGSVVTTVNVVIVSALKITGTLPEQGVGNPFSFTPTVTGGNPSQYTFTYKCTYGLPSGIVFNNKTGGLNGTCNTPISNCYIIITCTDGSQSASLTITLNVIAGVSLIPNQSPIFSIGTAGTYQIQGSNLTGSLVYSVIGGSLPPGLSLNTTLGVISGIPTTVGSYPVSIQVIGPVNKTTAKIIFTVVDDLSISSTLPVGTIGIPYSFTPTVTGGNKAKYRFTLTVNNNGVLIPGLSFNTATGAITGTPTTTGYIHVTITVTDGQTTASLKNLPLLVQSLVNSSSPQASQDYIQQLLQEYVTTLTGSTVTDTDRAQAIKLMIKASQALVANPTSANCELFYEYHTQYQNTLFETDNFFVGQGLLPNSLSLLLSGVYSAFRSLVTTPDLNVSFDYLGAYPINCVPLLNWVIKKRNLILQMQQNEGTTSNGKSST